MDGAGACCLEGNASTVGAFGPGAVLSVGLGVSASLSVLENEVACLGDAFIKLLPVLPLSCWADKVPVAEVAARLPTRGSRRPERKLGLYLLAS